MDKLDKLHTRDPDEISFKAYKLTKLANKYQRKEATPASLKQIITTIRYVLKYFNNYPTEFKDAFRAWMKLIKDFVLRCDAELQLLCFSQVSVILMYALKIRFHPVYAVEDILNDWIDLLIMVPVEITGKVVETGSSKLHTFIGALKGIGHYKYQALLMEILSRYVLAVSDENRPQVIEQLLQKTPNDGIMRLLIDFDIADMEKSIRLFLNTFNASFETTVVTFEVESVSVEGTLVRPPMAGHQWIDFNKAANSLSFYGESSSESTIWNYFEVVGGTVDHISRGLNLTAVLELKSKLLMNFCVDDEYHKDFHNSRHISIRFTRAERLEDFLALALSPLTRPASNTPLDIVVDFADGLTIDDGDNLTNNTMNFSVLSKNSFDNGELRARFSFMGDEEPETQPEEGEVIEIPLQEELPRARKLFPHFPIQLIDEDEQDFNDTLRNRMGNPGTRPPRREPPVEPTRKRKLFSNQQFEISTPPNSTFNTSNKLDETWEKKPQLNHKPTPNATRIFKTDPMVRIPIYKTILDDWKSDEEDDGKSIYSFKCNDPPPKKPTATKAKAIKRGRQSTPVRKPIKPPPKVTQRSAPTKPPAAKKSKVAAPAKKQLPLNIFRRSTSRATALEAKMVFNLKQTPPHCDDVAEVEKDKVVEVHSGSDDAKMIEKYITGFYKNRRSTTTVSRLPKLLPMMVSKREVDRMERESTDEYVNFQAEIRGLDRSWGDVMDGVKRMKMQIVGSNNISDLEKASLLAELCNLLLKK